MRPVLTCNLGPMYGPVPLGNHTVNARCLSEHLTIKEYRMRAKVQHAYRVTNSKRPDVSPDLDDLA